MANELTWITVQGYFYDVEQPDPSATSIKPQLLDVSAFVDFFPGTEQKPFPTGFYVTFPDLDHGDGTSGDTIVPLAPITARLMNGALCAIAVADPVGIELIANAAILGLVEPLYYHVRFRNVTFGGGGIEALSNFAYLAPSGSDAPAGLAATPVSGGSLTTATTYYYAVTAKMPGWETLASTPVSCAASSPNLSASLSWTQTTNATGYNIYRGTASNALDTLVTSITGASTVTYTDTGSAGTAVVAPSTDVVNLTSPLLVRTQYGGPN